MIGSTRSVRVWVYGTPADLRKSYDSLSALVRLHMASDPMSGDMHLFINRRCDRAKVLFFDGTGMCIYMKRLSKGKFAAPWKRKHAESFRLTLTELSLFLEGSELVFHRALSPEAVTNEDMQAFCMLR